MSCSQECGCTPGAVALVFIPGIMGTRLMNTQSGDSVWDPAAGAGMYINASGIEAKEAREAEMKAAAPVDDDGFWSSGGKWFERQWVSVKSFGSGVAEARRVVKRTYPRVKDFAFAGPAERKALLSNDDGDNAFDRNDALLSIDPGTDDYFKTYTSVPAAQVTFKRDRGWGEVLWDSYGGILRHLESKGPELKKDYPGLQFPVFAIGYNWMLSNEAAGEVIKTKIAEFKAQLMQQDPTLNDGNIKVIMITHSMGGYAGRAATQLAGIESDIEAVIHGAMPTHGSPSLYQQFRAGQSDIKVKFVLGQNAATITAVAGFSQGGLELLPNQLYTTADNDPEWLFYNPDNGEGHNTDLNIGYGSNIFNFYQQFNYWYSMVQPELLAPEMGINKLTLDDLGGYTEAYIKRIKECESFHGQLAAKFHHSTSALYSTNKHTKAFDKCVWQGKAIPDGEVNTWLTHKDENHSRFFGDGTVKLMGRAEEQAQSQRIKGWQASMRYSHPGSSLPPKPTTTAFTLQEESAPGDGTVQEGAGNNLSIAINTIGIDATEEHQGFFNDDLVRKNTLDIIKQALPGIHRAMGGK